MFSIILLVCDTAFGNGVVDIHFGLYIPVLILDCILWIGSHASNGTTLNRLKNIEGELMSPKSPMPNPFND